MNGWYNHPVSVTFKGQGFSGPAPCLASGSSATSTYAGPDTLSTAVSATCTDPAGKSVSPSLSLRYDATPPTITAAIPSRPPDFNGWYNHPVSFVFTGTDATSGIEGCSTVTYAGPDSESARVVGSCRDHAGNVASLAVPFLYHATPPSLAAGADAGDGVVVVRWRASTDVEIMRYPGLHGAQPSVVYHGHSGAFADKHARDGVRYEYKLVAQDQAGNVTVRTVSVIPDPRLLTPKAGARLSAPPFLHWTPVRRADYYNVQLYRGGKVLTLWPAHDSLRLRSAWSFDGHRYKLKPGRYRWYVWPGFGPRAAAQYGRLIGTRTFVIDRRS